MKTPLILLLFCFFALVAKADAANQFELAPLKSKGDRVTINDESVKIMEVGSDYILGLSASGVATIKRKGLAPEVERQINWSAPPPPPPKKEPSPQEIAAEKEKFKQLNTHQFYVLRVLDDGLLVNTAIWVGRTYSTGGVGDGGGSRSYALGGYSRGDDLIMISGFPKEGVTESTLLNDVFILDGTYTYRDAQGDARVISKYKYVKTDRG